jgi:hypothetical protein
MATGYKTATVNASDVPGTLSNYPAYVDLSRLGITTLAEAESIRVYADEAKTTEWAREIVSEIEMHVKVPSLTSTVEIFVEWDGVSADYAATDTYGRNNTWNSVYRAVYHNQASGGVDATGNGYTLTETSASYDTALLGDGLDCGTTSNIRRLSLNSNLGIGHEGAFTTSFIWKQTSDSASGTPIPFRFVTNTSTNYKGFQIQYESTPRVRIFAENSLLVAGALGTGINHFFITRASGASGQYTYYRNAASQGTVNQGANNFNSTGEISIGANSGGNAVGGWMDEVRVADSVLGANWSTTEYNNHSDEAGFWGTWTDAGGGATPRGGILLAW